MSTKVRFLNKDKSQFFSVLRKRVDDYFIENKISPHANTHMVIKTVVMLALYFVPYFIIVFGGLSLFGMWLCTLVMGTGLAGIGMSVMHDANHGAYSANPNVNKWVGRSLSLVGGDVRNWKTQHNVLHHTYTNIQGLDKDIDDKVIMRFSPNGKYKKIQRIQVVYVFLFYSVLTLYWIVAKDFVQFFQFIKEKHNKENTKTRVSNFLQMLAWKIFYYAYIFVVPIVLLDLSFLQVLVGFLSFHVIGGLILSIVFQLAHVVENTTFPKLNESGNIETDWAIHQLQTTADFSKNSWLITYYVGGLNYQAIHHLFPRICHVHYPKIAPIVEQTAKEFGVPYIYNDSISKAFISHIRIISKLGKNDTSFSAVVNSMG